MLTICGVVACGANLEIDKNATNTGQSANGGSGGTGAAGGIGGTTNQGGDTGAGGNNTGGSIASGPTGPSCQGLAANCGPSSNEDCCKSLLVPGGMFLRNYDGVDYKDSSHPATVSGFYFDRFEVTVGRFRAFVDAGAGTQLNPPSLGDGAHPLVPTSGWDSSWNAYLPSDEAALKSEVTCGSGDATWTDAEGANETLPMGCLNWYMAFAFCAWDEGRLPTETEWHFAAGGGDQQRYYPWSNPSTSTAIDETYAVYCVGDSCGFAYIFPVGARSPTGDGRWGHADLSGSVWEWALDWYAPLVDPCDDCANLTVAFERTGGGGGWAWPASFLRAAARSLSLPTTTGAAIGVRCVRIGPPS